MRVLFFLPHSHEAPGCRYRVFQYIPYLEERGVQCELRTMVDSELYQIVYKPGRTLRKAALFARRSLHRLRDLRDARNFDLLFIYRECFPIGPAVFETFLRTLDRPIVYDFDDAIYLPRAEPIKNLFRNPSKTTDIIRLSDRVIVSNEHLRGLCAAYNRNVDVIPTSVDTTRFCPAKAPPQRDRLRIGWIGTHSTAKYLDLIRRPLQRLAEKIPMELLVVGAGRDIAIPGVHVINKQWNLTEEIEDFQSLDIGVYPLADDLWELGKAGFKAIQYMSVGVPAVASPVGVVTEMIRDGENGFFASSEEEWLEKLTRLAGDYGERLRVGAAGRQTVVSAYSTANNAPRLLESLEAARRSFNGRS